MTRHSLPTNARHLRLAVGLAILLASGVGVRTTVRERPAPVPTDDAAIVHALNRVAFGPAAGDVERVRAIGLRQYLDGQLHPERLTDSALRARLAPLSTLTLSSRELSERFYEPLLEARRERQRREGAAAAPARPAREPDAPRPGDDPAMAPAEMSAAERPPEAGDGQALANLSPEQRRQAMELRREGQKVLNELGTQKLLRAVYSERQLEEVLVDFWFNHFNVFAGKGAVRVYLTEYERDAIRPHVFGTFRELLGAVAQSPAMLFYLDNWQSADPQLAERVDQAVDRRRGAGATNGAGGTRPGMARGGPRGGAGRGGAGRRAGAGATGRGADGMAPGQEERLAQIRQRMPRGLNENYARELLELHTLGVDGGYTQQDVVEVAKAFTGWTLRMPRAGGGFWFDDRRHVKGAKQVLGTTIDRGGRQDGEAVLDLLAAHPSTATFIATKLARRFVADQPPASLVARAAETFRATKGNLREVTRTIVTSPEFFAPDARRAKVKTPLEFVASALRAARAEVSQAGALLRSLRELGMPLYFAQPPTGYADRADAWVNTGALVGRMNFAVSLVGNRLPGVRTDVAALAGGTALDPSTRTMLVETMLQAPVSAATKGTIEKGSAITEVAALALGSPEFQRR